MWTNKALKSMFDKYAGRINAIHLNNGKVIMIDYPGKYTTKSTDISFETVDGIDLIVIDHIDNSTGREVHFKSYSTTEFVEGVDILSEEDAQYRIDPLRFK